MPKAIDISGNRYGHLIALYRDEKDHSRWYCRCDCGKVKSIPYSNFKYGTTKSCGCGQGKPGTENNSYKHGGAKTKLHNVWKSMRQRCRNKNCHDYKWYGGVGIDICSEWDDFSKFREWADSSGYKEGLTIERIDSTKNYSPENCTWKTIQEQQQNKKSNHLLEYYGEVHPMSVWSRKINMKYSKLSWQISTGKTLYDIIDGQCRQLTLFEFL